MDEHIKACRALHRLHLTLLATVVLMLAQPDQVQQLAKASKALPALEEAARYIVAMRETIYQDAEDRFVQAVREQVAAGLSSALKVEVDAGEATVGWPRDSQLLFVRPEVGDAPSVEGVIALVNERRFAVAVHPPEIQDSDVPTPPVALPSHLTVETIGVIPLAFKGCRTHVSFGPDSSLTFDSELKPRILVVPFASTFSHWEAPDPVVTSRVDDDALRKLWFWEEIATVSVSEAAKRIRDEKARRDDSFPVFGVSVPKRLVLIGAPVGQVYLLLHLLIHLRYMSRIPDSLPRIRDLPSWAPILPGVDSALLAYASIGLLPVTISLLLFLREQSGTLPLAVFVSVQAQIGLALAVVVGGLGLACCRILHRLRCRLHS